MPSSLGQGMPSGSPLNGPPPLPPSAPPAQSPNYNTLAGQGQSPSTPGGSQIMDKAIQMSYEIEMAIKLLAQAVPQLGPWAMQVIPELRQQLSAALASGVSTSASPMGNSQMPDGSANL